MLQDGKKNLGSRMLGNWFLLVCRMCVRGGAGRDIYLLFRCSEMHCVHILKLAAQQPIFRILFGSSEWGTVDGGMRSLRSMSKEQGTRSARKTVWSHSVMFVVEKPSIRRCLLVDVDVWNLGLFYICL